MLTFDVDPRDQALNMNGCAVCCCQAVNMRPGEVNKWLLNYAYWSLPIGGRGISANHNFSLEKIHAVQPTQGGFPVIALANPTTTLNTALTANLTTYVTDPDANTLVFSKVPLFDVSHGTLVLNANGSFTYTPNTGFTGYDRFFFQVTDGVNKPIVGEVIIGVAVSSAAAAMLTPAVKVDIVKSHVNVALQQLSFPVEVTPIALQSEIWRLQIRQEALDCDCNSYWNISCFDITIGKC